MTQDVRWRQRYQNFDRAFILLRSALEEKTLDEFSELEQEGLIQRFEYTYELAWKTLKDYLEESGIVISPVTPRNVIKQAFSARIIDDGQVWIDMMLHRNLLSHTYDYTKFREVLEAVVTRYLTAIGNLHEWLLEKRLES
ncbi:MAG: nucleotidyltransferase substrate binding protein [Pseudomonadota bacterium]